MKIIINIEVNDDSCDMETMREKGHTEESIIDLYNRGLGLVMEQFGGPSSHDCISVNTRIYDNKTFDVRGRWLKRTDYLRLKAAINIIKDMTTKPSECRVLYDGNSYVDFNMLESRSLLLHAIDIVKDFVIENGIEIDELEVPDDD